MSDTRDELLVQSFARAIGTLSEIVLALRDSGAEARAALAESLSREATLRGALEQRAAELELAASRFAEAQSRDDRDRIVYMRREHEMTERAKLLRGILHDHTNATAG